MLGFLPVAITFAIAAGSAGLSEAQTVFMSVLVFAGASQIMAVQMLADGAAVPAIVLATFILNLRHLIMSTCVFGKIKIIAFIQNFRRFRRHRRAFCHIYDRAGRKCRQSVLAGVLTGTYFSWVGGTIIGSFAENFLPQILSDSFGVALYALFISLIAPDIAKSLRLALLVILTAGINCLLRLFIAPGWAVILSAMVCAYIGVFFIGDNNETAAAADKSGTETAKETAGAGAK